MQKNHNNIPKIRVIVRKRPLSKKEFARGEKDIIEIPNHQTVLVKEQKVKLDLTPYVDEYKLIFDAAFNQNATNQQIYVSMVRPLIDAAFDGAKVSCFAYGQTGSGKTYTMLGDGKNVRGLYLLASQDVFNLINTHQGVSVWVSFYEIYCGKLYDLLNERNILYARQDAKNNINIVGLSERQTQNITEVMNLIDYGTNSRVTAQNSTNVDSSRSHAILQITLKIDKKMHGKISFIDLAGSERAADHADQTQKQTRIDGAEINKSLLALKECIRALDQNKHHTPFRGSKLTMVLKDSFVGYCKTVMIANVSPNSSSCENTLNTLKYADRVKELKKSNNHQKMPDDYLNNLSRELMLPRQLINHHQVSRIDHPKHSQSENTLMRNNYVNEQIEIDSVNKPKFNYQNRRQTTNMMVPQQRFEVKEKSARKHRAQSQMISNSPEQKPQESQEEVYERLNQRHEQMLQKVIEGEERLISEHTQYIDFSVETTKKHIELMKESDQQGSSIQNYLNQLDSNLEKQLQAIYKIKSLIENLKYNLDESKKIQQLYMQINEKISHISQVRGNPTMFRHQNPSMAIQQNPSMIRQQNFQLGRQQQNPSMIYQQNQQNMFGNYNQNYNQQNQNIVNYRSQGLGQLNFNYGQYHGDMGQQMNADVEIDGDEQLLFDD